MQDVAIEAPQQTPQDAILPATEVDAGMKLNQHKFKKQRSHKVDLDHDTERKFSTWGKLGKDGL